MGEDQVSQLFQLEAGSRGVTLRAGPAMEELIRVAHEPAAGPPATVRGDTVTVRRLRGGGRGELELNPAHPWRVRVHAPTWHTLLDLAGIDVREVHVDSGATHVECRLPRPRGVVPIQVSSGVVSVRLQRPPVVQLRLDGFSARATIGDLHWESRADAAAGDHYRLRISSGAVRISLEEDPSLSAEVAAAAPPLAARPGVAAALEVAPDGVEQRLRA